MTLLEQILDKLVTAPLNSLELAQQTGATEALVRATLAEEFFRYDKSLPQEERWVGRITCRRDGRYLLGNPKRLILEVGQ